jgi:hypothetical protein
MSVGGEEIPRRRFQYPRHHLGILAFSPPVVFASIDQTCLGFADF